MSGREKVLALYRRIMRAAKSFPSVKRDRIIEDIRVEFREGSGLVDEAKIDERVRVAQRSLQELESYVGMSRGGSDSITHTLRGSCE